ncbi:histone-lysine N-methyltransferase, H3 lysine-9 specific [Tricharina praecox]|uniref:histone-lysine N-methyltransferase, H3 lysine-9 specific n=1 Tax=Tricharina praecox TaxID=43433 RepID=UPI00222067AA|nr:histone-lysine N-methyltransferase, H3 lysine-9 specific [Tricharina praecox]KAI5855663.1 histone-lysine N-methyltransferase, H3 lysine-9 specific [Tricharina praecox]
MAENHSTKVVDVKYIGGHPWYRVTWKGLGPSYDTWEPTRCLGVLEDVVKQWKERTRRKRRASNSTSITKRLKLLNTSKREPSLEEEEEEEPFTIWDLVAGEKPPYIMVDKNNQKKPGMMASKSAKTKPYEHKDEPTRPAVLANPKHHKFLKKLAKIEGPQITLVNSVDDEPCPPLDFEFIKELRLTDSLKEIAGVTTWNNNFTVGCSCPVTGCVDKENCDCLDELPEETGRKQYDKHGRITRNNQYAIFECNSRCNCGPQCSSRVVQKGRKVKLEIFKTTNKGWGLRSPEFLKKGTFVELYLGEVIGPTETRRRADAGNEMNLSYLFDLDKFHEQGEDVLAQDSCCTIDGRDCGAASRFINHSCDPNLLTYAVTSERQDGKIYNLALFTARDIQPYEELTFSYTSESAAPTKKVVPTKDDKESKPCLCGSDSCVGFLWA